MEKQQPLTAILKHSQNIKLKSFQIHSRKNNRCRRKIDRAATVNIVIDSTKKTVLNAFCPSKAGWVLTLIQKIDCYRRKCSCCLLFGASFQKRDARGSLQSVPSSHVFRAYGVVSASWQTQQTRQCSCCQNSVANKENYILFTLPEQRGKESEPDIMLHAAWQTKQTRHYLFCHTAWQTKQNRHCIPCQYSLQTKQTRHRLPCQYSHLTNKANQTLFIILP